MTGHGTPPRVLSIAGTDPTGGAGLQADLKSIAANGGYGMGVVTALVAQNTHGVRSVHTPPAGFLREQLDAVSDDVTIDAVKIGMLGSVDVVEVVAGWLADVSPPVVVLDPVMVATSGHRLLEAEAEDTVRGLVARAGLVTPNIPELALLLDVPAAESWQEVLRQARQLSSRDDVVVLAKGGHLAGAECPDALVDRDSLVELPGHRVDTRHTHGTGCSISSAMATRRAATGSWEAALREVKPWLRGALEHAGRLHVGSGNGPIDHFHHAPGPASVSPVDR